MTEIKLIKPYLEFNGPHKEKLHYFFNKVINNFYHELKLMRETLYEYRGDKNNQYRFLYQLNESAYFGLFSTAIKRSFGDSVTVLQEFCVHDIEVHEEKKKGRADMLVQWRLNDEKAITLLFEGKAFRDNYVYNTNHEKSDVYYILLELQAKKYYLAEKEYYTKYVGVVKIVSIAFGWLEGKVLYEALKYFEPGADKDPHTEFCALFKEGDYGMWFYGRSRIPDEIPNS